MLRSMKLTETTDEGLVRLTLNTYMNRMVMILFLNKMEYHSDKGLIPETCG